MQPRLDPTPAAPIGPPPPHTPSPAPPRARQPARLERRTWPLTRATATRLARAQHAAVRQVTTFLWVLAGALLYQSARSESVRELLVGAGVVAIALAVAVVALSRRRMVATMTMWHLRDGCSPSEAQRRAKRDVRQVWSADPEPPDASPARR